jgi:hypothetical protein
VRRPKRKPEPQTAQQVLLTVADAAARIAASPDGKTLFKYLHEKVSARSTFVPGDPYATHLKEGMRVVLAHIQWLAELGRTGPSKVYVNAEEQPIWEQTRDVIDIGEEISNGDVD